MIDVYRYKIVRHRVVWLIGNWATVKLSPSLLTSIYFNLLAVLRPQEDLVIRLTAADSLRLVIDDFEFSAEEFSPYLADCVQLLVQLLCTVSQPDTKLRVLTVLSILMERMESHIQPHIPTLLQCLPSLWETSTQENSSLLRIGVLNTLTNIVRGLGPLSIQLHEFVLPVVHLATDVNTPEHVYLMEEGLDL
ncbi:Importin-11 [Geodia barretti]|uniref:Importin-11 n=1 Tax=Geodia barretti TaxID=519541 RepID=A0AA35R8C0_GEOBA|nr:Importin-11 [Geodia barretti]